MPRPQSQTLSMARDIGSIDKREAFLAAVRRFPQLEMTIARLMKNNEAFRDICEELAEAELALSLVDRVRPELREARRAEWQELVDQSVGELQAALQEANAGAGEHSRHQ
jgi:uncharacterized protein YhaN